jgi:hypothetical protein
VVDVGLEGGKVGFAAQGSIDLDRVGQVGDVLEGEQAAVALILAGFVGDLRESIVGRNEISGAVPEARAVVRQKTLGENRATPLPAERLDPQEVVLNAG